jgi:hypothetical protein
MENIEEVKKSKGKESRFGKPYGVEIKLHRVKLFNTIPLLLIPLVPKS